MKWSTPMAQRLRIRSRMNQANGCIEWIGAIESTGYGQIRVGAHLEAAHRVSYRLAKGEIPLGMLVLHKCDNRKCINVEHLFIGDYSDNAKDMVAKGRQGKRGLYGSNHPMSKLTPQEVLQIRRIYAEGRSTQKMLSVEFGICQDQIGAIVRRESWAGDHGEFDGIRA